jgi:hypothetical protein
MNTYAELMIERWERSTPFVNRCRYFSVEVVPAKGRLPAIRYPIHALQKTRPLADNILTAHILGLYTAPGGLASLFGRGVLAALRIDRYLLSTFQRYERLPYNVGSELRKFLYRAFRLAYSLRLVPRPDEFLVSNPGSERNTDHAAHAV